MCGINGIAYSTRSGKNIEPTTLRRMRDVIVHRGPDAFGEFIDGRVGLGHRRLSIVDVAHGGQPMTNDAGTLAIVYNGEVYNHREHRAGLESKGYVYRTHCDTETILYLYEEHGAGCVEYLRGMFAFAIWDRRDNSLFLARDRFGVKPLYYFQHPDGSLFFASEIKSLLENTEVRPELNYNALPDQFANHGTSVDETLFMGVRRLLPGHTLRWRDGAIEIGEYWDLRYEPKFEPRRDSEFVEEWRAVFDESVRLRLMADVPLGMFLSGGIDSSAIAAVMSTMVDEPIKTFSVGFREREANEFEYARMVAKRFGTDHHEITITPEQFFEKLPDLVWHEDEPIGFIASVPLYFVSKLAQEHVKVVLTGEGSDEMLAGYARYDKALRLIGYGSRYENAAPAFVRSAIRSGASRIGGKLARTFLARTADVESLFLDNFAVFGREMQSRLFSDETRARINNADPYASQNAWLEKTDAREMLDKLLYVDSKTYLHELLMKQDQMSMAASVESRVPFLDHKLAELTARMPVKLKLRGRTTKFLLKEAMRGVLPDEIRYRQKMGFPVPVGAWFRGKFRTIVDEYVLGERARARNIFDAGFVGEIVRRHNAGENHDERLWALVNFEIWQRRFFDREP
jgi:asparagine synthase (glutamine-hydrolysing)